MSTLQGIKTVAFKKCFHTRIYRLVVYFDLVVISLLFYSGFSSFGVYFVEDKLIRFLKKFFNTCLGMMNSNLLVILYKIFCTFFPTQINPFHFKIVRETKYLYLYCLLRVSVVCRNSVLPFLNTLDPVCSVNI